MMVSDYVDRLLRETANWKERAERAESALAEAREQIDHLTKEGKRVDADADKWMNRAAIAEAANDWILVSEKLPEIGAIVVAWKSRNGLVIVEYSTKSDEHRKWVRKDGQWWDDGDRITHWRSLPVPPEEGPR